MYAIEDPEPLHLFRWQHKCWQATTIKPSRGQTRWPGTRSNIAHTWCSACCTGVSSKLGSTQCWCTQASGRGPTRHGRRYTDQGRERGMLGHEPVRCSNYIHDEGGTCDCCEPYAVTMLCTFTGTEYSIFVGDLSPEAKLTPL